MNIKYVSFTNSGLQREENEDTIYAFEKENCAVFIVADGMGGCENGKNASDTIVRHIARFIELDLDKIVDMKKQFDKGYDSNDFYEDIKKYLLNANSEIYENYTAKGHMSGSTLMMIAFYDNTYNIFWAGDSHIYQVIDNELVALTVDDVWENDKNLIEGLTIEQIKNNQNYGRLTNAFGTIPNVNIHIMNGILVDGMKILLCSDGVYKYCDHKVLSDLILAEEVDKEKLGERIKTVVYNNGALDNLSFIYIETGSIN